MRAKIMNERFPHKRGASKRGRSAARGQGNFIDMLMELEQRIAFDAAGAATTDAAAERDHAPAEASAAETSHSADYAALASALESQPSDGAVGSVATDHSDAGSDEQASDVTASADADDWTYGPQTAETMSTQQDPGFDRAAWRGLGSDRDRVHRRKR